MFTGIIEEIGTVKEVIKSTDTYQLVISARKILEDVHLGDSISVNGICLTVTSFTAEQFRVDVMPETIKATSLQALTRGSNVNLERALLANGRFGGHIVSGHVDGVGRITERKLVQNAVYFWIEASPALLKYIVPKGSITVDGISLTVVEVTENQFSISIIPHTLTETILQYKHQGDLVNLECDMLAKYVEKLIQFERSDSSREQRGLTLKTLSENGFI